MDNTQFFSKLREINGDDWYRYRPVLNVIRRSCQKQTIDVVLKLLGSAQSEFVNDRPPKFLPWNLLLLLKWALAFGNADPQNCQSISRKQFVSLLNQIGELSSAGSKALFEHEDLNAFLRTISFQQFGFQTRQIQAGIGRNHIIFHELPIEPEIEDFSQRFFGASIDEVVDLFVYLAAFTSKTLIPTIRSFDILRVKYDSRAVENFLDLISVSFDQAKAIAIESTLESDLKLQITAESPFKLRPFLRFGDRLHLIHSSFLDNMLSNGVFELLRSLDKENRFSPAFGRQFEKYLDFILESNQLVFLKEAEQKKCFGDGHKVVDAIFGDSQRVLLIESKAIDMPSKSRSSTSPVVVKNALRSSVIQGLKQCFSVANVLHRKSHFGLGTNKIDVLILTFRDFNLGIVGGELWHKLFEDEIKDYCAQAGIESSIVDPWRIHIVPIDTFEKLLEGRSMREIFEKLDEIQIQNRNSGTAKYSLVQFLDNINEPPKFLKSSYDRQFEKIISIMREIESRDGRV